MNRSRVTVQTSCRGRFFRVTTPLEVGRAGASHSAEGADIEHTPAVVRGITERRKGDSRPGVPPQRISSVDSEVLAQELCDRMKEVIPSGISVSTEGDRLVFRSTYSTGTAGSYACLMAPPRDGQLVGASAGGSPARL